MASILILIILWVLYFVVHSIFASNNAKAGFKKFFPGINRFYRIIYVFFSIIGLVVIFLFQSSLPLSSLYEMNAFSTCIGLSLSSLGILVVIKSFSYYDTAEFLGLRQAKGDMEEQGFLRRGILCYVRHPLYTGSMVFLTGYLIIAPNTVNLVSVFCMIVYFIIGSYFEEKKLIKTFGEAYLIYKSEVPAFIPNINQLLKRSV